jgi:magnesium transporter
VIIDWAVYQDGVRLKDVALEDAFKFCSRDHDAFSWFGLFEPSDEELRLVSEEFELHELAVEDAISAHQRPKLENYGDTAFVVLKTARYVDPSEVIEFGEIQLFVSEKFIVSVRHGTASELHGVRLGVEKRPELLRCGPAAVAHAIVDHIVDDYADVVAGVDIDIGELEREVFSHSRENPAERIYKLKREVLEFHAAVAPLIEPLSRIANRPNPLIHEEMRPYFGDVLDHAIRIDATVERFRELLHGILEANLAQVSVRQNEDMRKITAWVAIAAVPTMVAGIYGMNFEHMPELEWTYGYPAVMAVVVAVCVVLYWRFRRSGWL